jgi:hypothetical protein
MLIMPRRPAGDLDPWMTPGMVGKCGPHPLSDLPPTAYPKRSFDPNGPVGGSPPSTIALQIDSARGCPGVEAGLTHSAARRQLRLLLHSSASSATVFHRRRDSPWPAA